MKKRTTQDRLKVAREALKTLEITVAQLEEQVKEEEEHRMHSLVLNAIEQVKMIKKTEEKLALQRAMYDKIIKELPYDAYSDFIEAVKKI